jgi:hypothetical protein
VRNDTQPLRQPETGDLLPITERFRVVPDGGELGQIYDSPDDQLEYQLCDRLSFRPLCGPRADSSSGRALSVRRWRGARRRHGPHVIRRLRPPARAFIISTQRVGP